ncbi:MAG: putative quinol monooxygenase [Rubrobacter sp.]
MADEQVSVVARAKAPEGMTDRLRGELEALVEPTRSEEGCINYDLHQGTEDPSVFFFYENWQSVDDLNRHLESPHVQAFLGNMDELTVDGVEITQLRMVSPPNAGTAGR